MKSFSLSFPQHRGELPEQVIHFTLVVPPHPSWRLDSRHSLLKETLDGEACEEESGILPAPLSSPRRLVVNKMLGREYDGKERRTLTTLKEVMPVCAGSWCRKQVSF